MKVKVLDNEWHHIHYDGKVYTVGTVLTIKDKDFDPKVFEEVTSPSEPTEPTVDAAPSTTETNVTITDVSTETEPSEEPPKTTKRKKK